MSKVPRLSVTALMLTSALSYAACGEDAGTPRQPTTASLLFLANACDNDYVVAAWPHWNSYPGFYSVVAQTDNTVVTLAPSATAGLSKLAPTWQPTASAL